MYPDVVNVSPAMFFDLPQTADRFFSCNHENLCRFNKPEKTGASMVAAIPARKPSIVITKKMKHIANRVATKTIFIAENKTMSPSILARKKPKPNSKFGRITHSPPNKAEKP